MLSKSCSPSTPSSSPEKRRVADVLVLFTEQGTPNGPTESMNGRLGLLRGSALGFRSLTHYLARCPLDGTTVADAVNGTVARTHQSSGHSVRLGTSRGISDQWAKSPRSCS